MKKIKTLLLILLTTSFATMAQINKPSLSPKITKELNIGLASIKLEYGQPSTQGRKIFGELIPYDKVWRTGANSSTKFTIDKDFKLSNHKIPYGSYALYSIPGKSEWTIIIHKNTKLWGSGGYNEANDLIRFKVPVTKLEDPIETLTISCENFNTNGGDLVIAWENTKIVMPVFIDSDPVIFKEIEEKIINASGEISAQTYFDAAQFYYHKEKNLEKAVVWFNKAIEMKPQAFWFVYYRAELAHHLKDNETAKKYATKCLEAAKSSSSGDYGYIAKAELLLKKLE